MATFKELLQRLWDARYLVLVVVALYTLSRLFQWIYKAYRVRTRYHDITSLPRHILWGNLVNAGARLNPSLKRHPDYGFEEIWNESRPTRLLLGRSCTR